jgi:hypothetical protein
MTMCNKPVKQCAICFDHIYYTYNFMDLFVRKSCKCIVPVHGACIMNWYEKRSTCLYCKQYVQCVNPKEITIRCTLNIFHLVMGFLTFYTCIETCIYVLLNPEYNDIY